MAEKCQKQKNEVLERKNQSCREFDGDHFNVFNIEFGGQNFLPPAG